MQYLVYIYHYVKEWRKNPKWSFTCCLALLLPLNELQGEIQRFTERDILTQQLQTGAIEMRLIGDALKESGAVDISLLEDQDSESEEEEEGNNEISIGQGLLALAKISIHELPRGTQETKLEDHDSELEQEKETTNAEISEQEEEENNEISIGQGPLELTEVIIHKPPKGPQDTKLEDHDSEQEEETTNVEISEQQEEENKEISTGQDPLELTEVIIHKPPRGPQDTKLEDHDSEQEEETTNVEISEQQEEENKEISIGQGPLELTEVIIHKPPRGTQDTKL